MSTYGILTTIGEQKLAASIGGAAVNLTTIRLGDGNGQIITPTPNMTDLVRRVGQAYPITSQGPDPANPSYYRVGTIVPASEGPFDVREIGVFDSTGALIAISRHPLIEKPGSGGSVAIELDTDIIFPVLSGANVVVAVQSGAFATQLWVDTNFQRKLLRMPFIAVNQVGLDAPPSTPAIGDSFIVGATPTGAWAGQAHNLAQWNDAWIFRSYVVDSLVVAQDTDMVHKRTVSGWEPWFATTPEHLAGLLATKPATPAGVAAMLANSLGGIRSTRLLARVGLRRPR